MSKSIIRNRQNKAKAKSRSSQSDSKHPPYPRIGVTGKGNGNGTEAQCTKVQRQFLDAYFRINVAYADLLALRDKWRSRPPKASEAALLRKIEVALVAREALEDRHASRGLVATPVYSDGFTVELLFADSRTGRDRDHYLVLRSSSVCLSIPLPAGLRAKLCKK